MSAANAVVYPAFLDTFTETESYEHIQKSQNHRDRRDANEHGAPCRMLRDKPCVFRNHEPDQIH